MLSNRDLDLLVCLRVLLEEANVTRAAQRLQMGQPAMSGALARLRLQFDDELLVRVGRDFELTPFARSIRSRVERSIQLIDDVLGTTEQFDPAQSTRTFTLVAPDHVVSELWPTLARIMSSAPGLSFDLRAEPSEPADTDQQLLKHDWVTVPPAGDIMSETAVLYRDRFVCVLDAANSSRPRDGAALSWDALRALPHAVAKVDKDFRSPVDLVLGEHGFSREPVMRLTSYLQLAAAVSGTDLCAILPERVARRAAARSRRVVIADLPVGPVETSTSLWWHPARRGDPGHAWVTAQLLGAPSEGGAVEDRQNAVASSNTR